MRDLFEIVSARGSHPVRISQQGVRDVASSCDATVVLADSFFRDQLAGLDLPTLFIEATEDGKQLTAIAPLIESLRAAGLARDGHILAIGGGVIQDVACFIATVYMRGVRWTLVPTTLLAMVDSCIGGKSSINVGAFKNLAGSFYPPDAIIIPISAIETLPAEHVAAGQCEAAKICFAHGDSSFDAYLKLDRQGGLRDPAGLVSLSLNAKKWFVEIDEFDQNERLLLNFGHSFGHAIESCTDYLVTHGVAVGVGCLAAVEASCANSPALAELPRVKALTNDLLATLTQVSGLSDSLVGVGRDQFFHFWRSDKKHSPAEYRPILIDETGFLYRAARPRNADTDLAIWTAFERARDKVSQSSRARFTHL